MFVVLPANVSLVMPVCPVCRRANTELALWDNGQVSCSDREACEKAEDAFVEWCDAQAVEMSARDAMERGIPLW